jgi:molecular chaperone DnaJ
VDVPISVSQVPRDPAPAGCARRADECVSDTLAHARGRVFDTHVCPCGQAVLGGKVKVPTLDRPQVVAVPPGTQPGKVVALRNHGIQHLQSARATFGDLLVHFKVPIRV